MAALEEQLVPYAGQASIADARRKLARLRIALDADGVDARTLAAYDEQHLTVTPVGDGYQVRGYLTKQSAAVLLTCLDQTVDGWFRDGSLTPEQAVPVGDDAISRGRRRMRRSHLDAVALVELCEHLLDDGLLGTRHQQRPHVTLTMHTDDYRAGLGGELHVPGRDAEPINAATVDRIRCDADITAVLTRSGPLAEPTRQTPHPGVTDPRIGISDGWLHVAAREVLYVGRTQCTAPPRLRRALTIRDRHCQFPDCRVSAQRCHAHHVEHWEHGGRTDLQNMLLLCHGHHHLVHEGHWTITAAEDRRAGQPGFWRFAPPRPRA